MNDYEILKKRAEDAHKIAFSNNQRLLTLEGKVSELSCRSETVSVQISSNETYRNSTIIDETSASINELKRQHKEEETMWQMRLAELKRKAAELENIKLCDVSTFVSGLRRFWNLLVKERRALSLAFTLVILFWWRRTKRIRQK